MFLGDQYTGMSARGILRNDAEKARALQSDFASAVASAPTGTSSGFGTRSHQAMPPMTPWGEGTKGATHQGVDKQYGASMGP